MGSAGGTSLSRHGSPRPARPERPAESSSTLAGRPGPRAAATRCWVADTRGTGADSTPVPRREQRRPSPGAGAPGLAPAPVDQ